MRFTTTMLTLLAVPALLAAQTPQIPNSHASDTAKSKVPVALQHRATHMRGSVVGLDNRPVTPAMPATPSTGATRATPATGGGAATPATPAAPATPAGAAFPSEKPARPSHAPR